MKTFTQYSTLFLGLAVVFSLGLCQKVDAKSMIKKAPFGKTPDGQEVYIYTLTNKKGMEARIMTYGGRLVSLEVPDRHGKLADIVLGYDNLEGYLTDTTYFGALIGRYANRIANGEFKLDGVTYHLPKNDGPNSLHGGTKGFDKRVWDARDVSTPKGEALELSYSSKNGEEGYPGNLQVRVTYTLLANSDEMRLDYWATTDKDTVLNLTNHSYFNLDGQGNGNILGEELMINADKFTPINSVFIPTGKIESVAGTPFDFRKLTRIGARIHEDNQQLKNAKGYDDNFVLNKKIPGSLTLAARAYDPRSGREMEIWTTQPGVQFYSGNFLDGTVHGKGGKVYGHRYGFCLETQHFPDSPNEPSFPSTELKAGHQFDATTIYKFSAH